MVSPSPPAVAGDSRLELSLPVVTLIPRDAGSIPIPYIGRTFLPHWDRTSVVSRTKNSKQYALKLTSTVPEHRSYKELGIS